MALAMEGRRWARLNSAGATRRSGKKDPLMSMRNVRGRPEVVVITGASAGVGRATVREFARRRAWVALLARSHDGRPGGKSKRPEVVPSP